MDQLAPRQIERLLNGINQGIHSHLEWTQRLLRCAFLHESPGDDMLQPDAGQRCDFGRWLHGERATLANFDAAATDELERQHRAMHDAVRLLCTLCARGQVARPAELQAYEAGQSAMIACLNVLRQRVTESMLQHDALTGLPLRNGLSYVFRLRQHDAARDGLPLHLAMVDVDHFKRVNDTWGHPVGDRILQHLARLMSACLRENDILIRYGGEEFLLLLLGQDIPGVVQRLLETVRSQPLPLDDGGAVSATITAGLTAVATTDTLAAAVERADRALLQGKQSGRDCCVIAGLPAS